MSADRLAHWPQDAKLSEVAELVGDGDWLTVSEAAKVTGLSEWKVRQLADSRELASTVLPGSNHRRISRVAAEAMRDAMLRDLAGE
jgi:excisionase family DNA binding protein